VLKEQTLAKGLPTKLNAGEREAIALSKNRKGRLLSNGQRAVRYCQQNHISVIDLLLMLRLLWTQKIWYRENIAGAASMASSPSWNGWPPNIEFLLKKAVVFLHIHLG
jgi:hypothetical protein